MAHRLPQRVETSELNSGRIGVGRVEQVLTEAAAQASQLGCPWLAATLWTWVKLAAPAAAPIASRIRIWARPSARLPRTVRSDERLAATGPPPADRSVP